MNEQTNKAFPVVMKGRIDGQLVQTVDGRDLHTFLEVGKDFSNWMRDRVEQYGFVENADFVVFANSGEKGRPSREYALTLDMAKEVAMVERNDRGKQVRKYFIECERRLKMNALSPGSHVKEASMAFRSFMGIGRLIGLDRNQAALAANRATIKTVGLDALEIMDATHLTAPQQSTILTATDIGARVGGKSGQAANQLLAERGFQLGHRDAKGRTYWEPTEAGKPYAVFQDTGKKHSDGTPVRQLKWSADILDRLTETAN
jgi:phage anti-repressor protein